MIQPDIMFLSLEPTVSSSYREWSFAAYRYPLSCRPGLCACISCGDVMRVLHAGWLRWLRQESVGAKPLISQCA